jgi:hypothetical protein
VRVLDFFRSRPTRSDRPAPPRGNDLDDWRIVTATNEETGQAAVFRARLSKPDRRDLAALTTAIVVKWPYGTEHQMPPEDVNSQQLAFEAALDPLSSSSDSELVHVSTGMGFKEWIYYARSRKKFMAELNRLLSGHPAYPLEIELYDDPEWRLWADMVESIKARDESGEEP